jgi:hypothetical protein
MVVMAVADVLGDTKLWLLLLFCREDQVRAGIEWSKGTKDIIEFGFCYGTDMFIPLFYKIKHNNTLLILHIPYFSLSAEKKARRCNNDAYQFHETRTDKSCEW